LSYEKAFEDYDVEKVFDVKKGMDLNFKNNDCPLINDLLLKGINLCDTPYLCLINSDVIVRTDFKDSIRRVFDKYGSDIFITGTRIDIDLKELINTPKSLKNIMDNSGRLYNTVNSAEVFITTKEIFKKMAETMASMIMGRYGWDNYIHFWMIANNIPCFNCTEAIPVYHCRHDHSHIENLEGKPGRKAPSSIHNLLSLRSMQDLYGTTVRINKWRQVSI
jgi:hypothetical protein